MAKEVEILVADDPAAEVAGRLAEAALRVEGRTAQAIFGEIDFAIAARSRLT